MKRSDANSGLVLSVVVAAMLGGQMMFWAPITIADERPAPQTDPLRLSISDIELNNRSSGLEALSGQLTLTLSVTNQSNAAVTLTLSQFTFRLDNQTVIPDASRSNIIPAGGEKSVVLAPGESHAGELVYTVNHPGATEPKLELSWHSDETQIKLNINKVLRELAEVNVVPMGPSDCLAVVEFCRPIDHMAIWVLTERFRQLQADEIDRVVLDVTSTKRSPPNYRMDASVTAWLMSVKSGNRTARAPFGIKVSSPVQFSHFHYVGHRSSMRYSPFGASRTRQNTGNSNSQNALRGLAIAESLKNAYDSVSITDAITDFSHSEPGVRQAAVEQNLDRLTQEQLQQAVNTAANKDNTHLALIAENLYRVPFADVTDTLCRLAVNDDKDVSQAALRSLIRCASPESAEALTKIWQESDQDTQLRRTIVTLHMEIQDHRHADLLAEFAEILLAQFCDDPDDGATADDSADPTRKATGTTSATDARLLKQLLPFLSNDSGSSLNDTIRRRLLRISDPGVQDVVITHILNEADAADTPLVRAYIEQRLPPIEQSNGALLEMIQKIAERFGPLSAGANPNITNDLLEVIRQYPDSAYTSRLLQVANGHASSNIKSKAFQTAVRTASDLQLQQLIDDFDSLEASRKHAVLQRVATEEREGWIDLLKQCVHDTPQAQMYALNLLRNRSSPEAIELLVGVLRETREEAEAAAEKVSVKPNTQPESGAETQKVTQAGLDRVSDQTVTRVLSYLQSATHPSVRRELNRCVRSPLLDLSAKADEAIRRSYAVFYQTSAIRDDIQAAAELRKQGNYAEAVAAMDDILEKEPFYSAGYVSRASMNMRLGNMQNVLDDLRRADQLDPEDPTIECIVAIALVRTGQLEEGVKQAEGLLASIPDLPTSIRRDTIYNSACVYGRAAEATEDAEQKYQYTDRGLQLLRASIERQGGFDDSAHLLNDPDLNIFHDHDQWQSIVDLVKANESKKPQP